MKRVGQLRTKALSNLLKSSWLQGRIKHKCWNQPRGFARGSSTGCSWLQLWFWLSGVSNTCLTLFDKVRRFEISWRMLKDVEGCWRMLFWWRDFVFDCYSHAPCWRQFCLQAASEEAVPSKVVENVPEKSRLGSSKAFLSLRSSTEWAGGFGHRDSVPEIHSFVEAGYLDFSFMFSTGSLKTQRNHGFAWGVPTCRLLRMVNRCEQWQFEYTFKWILFCNQTWQK